MFRKTGKVAIQLIWEVGMKHDPISRETSTYSKTWIGCPKLLSNSIKFGSDDQEERIALG